MDYIKSATMIFGKIRNRVEEEKLKLRLTKKEVQQYIAGKEGEELVSKVLKDSFPEMILLDDIYMDVSDLWYEVNGYVPTMQIDHILISNHVIYVIETKKYPREAEVSGSSFSQTWTYKDSSIRHSSRYNADRQNQKHVENLKKLCEFENIPIISIVCLVNMNSENIHVNTLYGRYVFMIEELPIMIEAIEKKYSRNNVDKLFAKEKIQTKNIKSFDIEVEHIIYVKLLKRKVRELRKGKRKRRKKSK